MFRNTQAGHVTYGQSVSLELCASFGVVQTDLGAHFMLSYPPPPCAWSALAPLHEAYSFTRTMCGHDVYPPCTMTVLRNDQRLIKRHIF